jgi:dihydroorotate dehydrogenase (NAD+) catalytic subunit
MSSVTDLSVQLGPLRLAYPLVNCSGTMEIFELAEALGSGFAERPPVAAYVPKTITLAPRKGNPPPRILETPEGMINAIGLPGDGLETFVARELPRLLSLPCPLILSIGGFSRDEYVALAAGLRKALDRAAGDAWTARVGLELNISCPNVHSGCASIGADPDETQAVVAAARGEWPGLLVAKLTPNVSDIVAIGRAAEAGGADAVAAVNTFKGLVLDRQTLEPYLGNVTGGLSGPAIKPLALRAVYELYEGLQVPIVGMGGVATAQDVLDFMACGARVVAVGSAGFQDPDRAAGLALALAGSLAERKLSVEQLIGWAHRSH